MYKDFQSYMERVQVFASSEPFNAELVKAKKEYFEATGEVFEEDHFFETRMAAFLDWYIFNRSLPAYGKTSFQLFLEKHNEGFTDEERMIFNGFAWNRQSVFEYLKPVPGGLLLRDLDDGRKYVVQERRGLKAFQKGDLFDARLFSFRSMYFFSGAFISHPAEAKKFIQKGFKALLKSDALPVERVDFLHKLAKLRLRFERYRHIKLEQIYA